jgi:hypothetical protein
LDHVPDPALLVGSEKAVSDDTSWLFAIDQGAQPSKAKHLTAMLGGCEAG